MYCAFFGFREKPFNLTPDPKFLYLNASYREALAALHYGIGDRKGFVSLIGEAGTGKTTLLRRLLAELPRETRSVLVINPAIGFEEMLRFILSDLGKAPARGVTKLDLLEALNAELLATLARGGNVVVLIDEAQDLSIPVLEELRLLSNLETAKEKILQLVLAGQPELDGMLARPELRQLRQRISVRARLRPLVRAEIKAYVAARTAAAGGDIRGLFAPTALLRLWWFSGGVPRLVNAACDNALVTAYAAGRRRVGWREMGEAIHDLRRQVTWVPHRLTQAVMLLAATAIGGGLLLGWMWRAHERPAAPVLVTATLRPDPSSDPVPSPSVVAGAAALRVESAGVLQPDTVGTPPRFEISAITASPGSSAARIVLTEAVNPGGAADGAAILAPTPEASSTPVAVGTPPLPEPPQEAPVPSAQIDASATGDLRIQITDGDTFIDLARRYYGNAGPLVVSMIRRANPWVDDLDVLRAGEFLVLPAPRLDGVVSQTDRSGAG